LFQDERRDDRPWCPVEPEADAPSRREHYCGNESDRRDSGPAPAMEDEEIHELLKGDDGPRRPMATARMCHES